MTRDSQKMPKQLQKLTRGRFAQLLHQSKARSAPARLSRRWALHPPRYFVLDPSLIIIIVKAVISILGHYTKV